jgi:hypothetical protein
VLAFTPLTEPTLNAGDDNNPVLVKKWEIKYRAFSDAEEGRTKATSQAFAIVLGQCSPTVVD